jgi:hypothetical protein
LPKPVLIELERQWYEEFGGELATARATLDQISTLLPENANLSSNIPDWDKIVRGYKAFRDVTLTKFNFPRCRYLPRGR